MLTGTELKEKLIAKISNTNDVELLQQISRVMELEAELDELDRIYVLSTAEMAAVNDGIKQIEGGLFISNEESDKQADQWLRK